MLRYTRIGTFNIGKSIKRIFPEHERYLAEHFDILCLTEIGVWNQGDFLERIGHTLKEGFSWFVRPRERMHKNARSASGGVAIGVKRSLARGVDQSSLVKGCEGIMCIRIPMFNVGLDRDVYICGVYIPPCSSSYTEQRARNSEVWQVLSEGLIACREKGYVLLMGDMNAHIGNRVVEHGRLDLDHVTDDMLDAESKVLLKAVGTEETDEYDETISPHMNIRSSYCMHDVDEYGEALLQLCLTTRLHVVNGCFGGTSGACTHVGAVGESVVDYVCIDTRLLHTVISCEVSSGCLDSISDHIPISVSVTWGLAAKNDLTVYRLNDEILSELSIWLDIDGWRCDEYSQIWKIRNGKDCITTGSEGLFDLLADEMNTLDSNMCVRLVQNRVWECAERSGCIV